MEENILNLFVIIKDGIITGIKAISHSKDGNDDEKIVFLKNSARNDFVIAEDFQAPYDKKNKMMTYKQFSKLERQGLQYQLFENIFNHFNLPENPIICLTPVVNGEILSE